MSARTGVEEAWPSHRFVRLRSLDVHVSGQEVANLIHTIYMDCVTYHVAAIFLEV